MDCAKWTDIEAEREPPIQSIGHRPRPTTCLSSRKFNNLRVLLMSVPVDSAVVTAQRPSLNLSSLSNLEDPLVALLLSPRRRFIAGSIFIQDGVSTGGGGGGGGYS